MKNMTIENIAAACEGEIVSPFSYPQDEIKGAVLDSRLVEEGYLFFATKGEKVDGHDFVKTAFEKGALCAVCERVPEGVNGPVIVVKDSFVAIKKIAEYYRSNLNIKVVGITGSVGKTSTKECIASVLSQKYNVLKTEGNFNNEVGLPLTVLKIRDNHEIAVLEMGISDFGEMTRLAQIAKPDVCVITNIGQCHLEKLIDRDGVLKAKTEMFNSMKENGSVVLFGDDDKLQTVKMVNGTKPIYYGMGENNDITADGVVNKGLWGSDFTIKGEFGSFKASMPLPGKHMIYNALAATAVGKIFKMDDAAIAAGITSVKSVGGRSNIIGANGITIIDDCYNANPVSMKAAIDLLCEAITPKVAILGDMFELGENEAVLHRGVGEYAATQNIDTIICIGELSKNTYEGAMSKVTDPAKTTVLHMNDLEELFERAPGLIRKDDAVLIKASHGMHFSQIVDELQEERYKDAFKPRAEKLFSPEELEKPESDVALSKNEGDKTIMDVKPDADKAEQKKAWKQVMFIAIGIVALILVIAGICLGINRRKYKEATRGVVLIENAGSLYSDGKVKDYTIAENFPESDFTEDGNTLMTDGKYIYCPQSKTESGYSLYACSVKGKNSKLIADNVTCADVVDKGMVLYISEGVLFLTDITGDKTKHIATNVYAYDVSDKKDAILIADQSGKISYRKIFDDNSVFDFDNGVSNVWKSSDDKTGVIYEKDGALYSARTNSQPTLLTDDFTDICVGSDSKNSFVYYISDKTLYYACTQGNTKPKKVAENVSGLLGTQEERPAFMFKSESDGENDYHIAYKDKAADLLEADGNALHCPDDDVYVDEKADTVYILDRKSAKETGSVIGVDMGSAFKTNIDVIADDVSSIEFVDHSNLFYCVNKGSNDLYNSGNLVARNVVSHSLKQTAYKDAFVFAYQVSDENGYYNLSVYNGNDIKQVGTTITLDYYPMSEKLIYFIGIGDEKRDIIKYNGKKQITVSKRVDEFKYLAY